MCIEMKTSIKMNTRLHQLYGVAVILRLRTTKVVAAGDMVLRMRKGLDTTGACAECVHLGVSISIVKKICSVLFALAESWTA